MNSNTKIIFIKIGRAKECDYIKLANSFGNSYLKKTFKEYVNMKNCFDSYKIEFSAGKMYMLNGIL